MKRARVSMGRLADLASRISEVSLPARVSVLVAGASFQLQPAAIGTANKATKSAARERFRGAGQRDSFSSSSANMSRNSRKTFASFPLRSWRQDWNSERIQYTIFFQTCRCDLNFDEFT